MVDADRDRLADAVRDLDPAVIVVDDAHADLAALHLIRQLRADLGARFRIAAVTWSGDVNEVTSTLAVAPASVLELKPLDRVQLLEVIEAAGIKDSIGVQKEILNQAAGLPGLAVTLCDIAIRGDLTQLYSGELLLREIRTAITRDAGETGMQVLAVMALAGESGASLKDVDAILDLSIAESHKVLAHLGHTGVFRAASLGERTTIWPRELRFAVVGSYFFSDRPHENLPLESSLSQLNERDIVDSLLGAALQGASVPPATIEPLLIRVGTDRDFSRYAAVGRQQASFSLDSRPQWLTQIAPYSLLWIPERTLPMLLEQAAEQEVSSAFLSDPPLQIIKRWIQSASSVENEQGRRRKILARITSRYANNFGNLQVVLEALCLAMDPKYVVYDVGTLSEYYSAHGLVSRECLESLETLWPEVVNVIPTSGPRDFTELFRLVADWQGCGQSPVKFELPDEVCSWMRNQSSVMMRDLAIRFADHLGVCVRLRDLFKSANIPFEMCIPREFEVLYPTVDYSVYPKDGMGGIEQQQLEFQAVARSLAVELAQEDPRDVIPRLLEFETSATTAGIVDEGMTEEFVRELTKHICDPYTWAQEAVSIGLEFTMLEPLLRASRIRDRDRAHSLVLEAFGSETAQRAAVWNVLTDHEPNDVELESALRVVTGMPELDVRLLTGALVRSGTASISTLKRLLCHPSSVVAGLTASHFRLDRSSPSVPPELRHEWRTAILRSDGKGDIGNILFVSDQNLLFDWIVGKLSDRKVGEITDLFANRIVVDHALPRLSSEQRVKILSAIYEDDAYDLSELISAVIADRVDIFREFLSLTNMEPVHELLFGTPTDQKIRAACDAGWSYEQIAHVVVFRSGLWVSWTGEESEYWKDRRRYFTGLARSDDIDIASVGQSGRELLDGLRSGSLRRERDENVYGR